MGRQQRMHSNYSNEGGKENLNEKTVGDGVAGAATRELVSEVEEKPPGEVDKPDDMAQAGSFAVKDDADECEEAAFYTEERDILFFYCNLEDHQQKYLFKIAKFYWRENLQKKRLEKAIRQSGGNLNDLEYAPVMAGRKTGPRVSGWDLVSRKRSATHQGPWPKQETKDVEKKVSPS